LKKIIIFSLLLTSLYSDAKIYTGLSVGYLNEEFSNALSTTSSAEMAKLKIGYGIREAYAIELSFDYLKNESSIFSRNGEKDNDKYGINIELVKAFDWDIYINPYFKAGFGAGYLKLEESSQDSLNYGTFNLGLGFFIPINEHFDFEVGYDYKYVSYEKFIVTGKDINSNMHGAYLGLNARF
jgi:hypothetical protein